MAWQKLYNIAYGERPISSEKYNREINSIYEKLNLLKTSFASSSTPTDFEVGQLWYDTIYSLLKVKTASGVKTLAYANNEEMVRSNTNPVFYTLDGSRSMSSSYTPSDPQHLTTKAYVDTLVGSHTSNLSNPHQTKENQVRDNSNPVFLTLDGSRSMSSSYTPTLPRDVTTKTYVDTLVGNHTSNLSNPHQTKESQVKDDTNPVFLTLDGTRYMTSTYVPTLAKHVATKEYVDQHANSTSNPHQTKESQVRDNSNPVFLTIDGSRSLASNYTPTNPQDIATKSYVDIMIETGGISSISSQYVTYSPSTPLVSIWEDVTNVKEALDFVGYHLGGGIISDTYKVKMTESDNNPDFLGNKIDTNYFSLGSGNILSFKGSLLNKVSLNEVDTPSYLLEKLSSFYFSLDANNKVKVNDALLYKVKLDENDSSPSYLLNKLSLDIFEVDALGKVNIKEKGLTLAHINPQTTDQDKALITNSLGDLVLVSIDTSQFNTSPTISLKDGSITTEKLASGSVTTEKLASTVVAPNSDKLDGYHASTTAQPNVIPVTNSSGKLDSSFLPENIQIPPAFNMVLYMSIRGGL